MTQFFAPLLFFALQTAATSAPPGPSGDEIRQLLVHRVDVDHWGAGIVVGIVSPEGRRITSYGSLAAGDKRPLDGNSVFEIGSISKVFTGLLLSDMVQRHEVSLADPVESYLPKGVHVPKWNDHPITLADLSTQTSGLPFFPLNFPDVDDPSTLAKTTTYSEKELYDFLGGYQLLHDVGVHWEYSNLGVGLLGLALARRENTNYDGILKAHVTGPLGMKSTSVFVSRSMRRRAAVGHDGQNKTAPALAFPSSMAGAGSLHSTANDLLTLLEAETGYRNTPLAPAMEAALKTVRPGADWLGFLGGNQALGWWVIGEGPSAIVAHAGDTIGFSCSIAFNPTARVGIVALSNCSSGGDQIAMHLLRKAYPYSVNGPSAPEPKEATVDPSIFDLYVGKYELGPNVILVISRIGDKLMFMSPGSPRVRLHPTSDRDFFIPSAGVTVSFHVGESGQASSVSLSLAGFTFPGKRIP